MSAKRVVAIGLAAQMIPEWTAKAVAFGHAFVIDERAGDDALEVSSLADQPRAIKLPSKDWPHAQLQIRDVRLQPARPAARERVTVVVTVRNVGNVAAPARVHLGYLEECSDLAAMVTMP